MPALTALQARLASGRGAVALGVSRATAERAAEIVRGSGGRVILRRAGEVIEDEDDGGRTLKMAGLALVALIGVAAATVFVMRGGGSTSTPVEPRVGGPAAVELSPEQVAARGLPATVSLACGEQFGSGFFVTKDLLVTNAHVLCPGTSSMTVRFSDGRESEGTVEGVDEALDLAVVRAPGLQAEPLKLGDAGGLKLGQHLTMIGSPLGLEFSVHECSVSSLDRHDLGLAFVQIDAAVNPGNSGGPLVDRRGRVVGIVTLKMTEGEGIALAVPINYAFSGPTALLDGYSTTHTEGFARMVARAEGASRREADKLQATGQRPGLVAAGVVGQVMMAEIIWPSTEPPFVRDLNFSLVKNEERICSITGEVPEWTKLEGKGDKKVLPPRMTLWLESHGFSADLYRGVAAMKWDHCPADQLGGTVDLQLENADDDARRVRLGE